MIYKENSGGGDEDEKVKVEGGGRSTGQKRKEKKEEKSAIDCRLTVIIGVVFRRLVLLPKRHT